ncbi:MAG: FAD-dependent oxidoreductase, partial [Galactobacillus timonensis]
DTELAVDGLFLAVGMKPETTLLSGIVDLNNAGYILAGEDTRTSVNNIFAAGDVRNKTVRQLTTAAADGTAAAIAAVAL